MKIGLSIPDLSKVAWTRDLGFDFAEVSATRVSEYSDEEFNRLCDETLQSGFPVFSANSLIPWQMGFFGENGTNTLLVEHLRATFARLSRLGVRLTVFGCGGARKAPEGFTYAQGVDRLIEVFRMAAAEAAPYGIVLALESLNTKESNVGNHVSECAAIVHAADPSGIHGVTADWYHMAFVGEAPLEVSRTGLVRHAHVAAGGSRAVPAPGDGEPYAEFLAAVREAGLDHVTVESHPGEDADYRAALGLLRSL